jgi:leucyl aminopeptidase (aminopeptidase T)
MTSMATTGTLEYLRRPLLPNIKPGMKVLVVTDTAHDARVWQAIMGILTELGADATLALFEPRPADYYDPPQQVCEAMLKSDVNILLCSTGMLHAPANAAAMKAGVPVICMDGGLTLEMFQSGAVTEDQREMAARLHHVATNVFGKDAKMCRVTSKFGTDLTYSVENRIYIPKLPDNEYVPYKISDFGRSKTSPLIRCLYPNGECNVAPVEASANGKLVIDLCMHQLGRLHEPITLMVKDSRVVSIEGEGDAYTLRNYLETYGDENAYYCPAEASVGINSKAVIRGVQREDKNILGSMHFGLGTNVDVGGKILSNIHMDGVILEPTLYVDGVKKIEHGKFLVPIDRPMNGG